MHIETVDSVHDDATGGLTQTLKLTVEASDVRRAMVAGGFDGLGDPKSSKGLQQVVFMDGSYVILNYIDAQIAAESADFICMIDVAALRVSLRQALN